MTILKGKLFSVFFALLFGAVSFAAHALPIEIVHSKAGITAWLVEDHSTPVVSIRFSFSGGVEQDPANEQGLSSLMADLMTEGAGKRDAAQFQQALADHGISFGLSAERDVVSGVLRVLRSDLSVAAALARDALLLPRFDVEDVERVRLDHIGAIKARLADPEWQARRSIFAKLFPEHPYAMRSLGSEASIGGLTAEDLRQEHARRFARDNLLVVASGDVTPEALGEILDKVFGGLPSHAALRPVMDVTVPEEGMATHIYQEGGQTVLLFATAGVKRADSDWYTAVILNYVLGGGGFSSRLMDEVRDKRGLTYGIGTSLSPMDHASIIIGQGLTANAKAGEAWDVTREVWSKTQKGITAKELADAKSYLIGSFVTELTSTDAIARVLLEMRQEKLPTDYLTQREALFNAVTLDDIRRVARRLLDPSSLTLVAVGKPEGIRFDNTENFVKE